MLRKFAESKGLTLEKEYKFHSTRKWRFDYALQDVKIAIEVNGGIWNAGAHGRGTGITRDYEKSNAAQILGWKYLQYTPKQFNDGFMIHDLQIIFDEIKLQ